jgi:CRISPR-associated RAMP protein (TIGR02581 family)
MSNESLLSFAKLHNRLKVTGKLVSETALRVGAGRDNEVTSNRLPVLRDGRGRPYLPGASLKGTLRSRMEALIRAIDPTQALDLLELEAQIATYKKLFEQDNELQAPGQLSKQDQRRSQIIWERSTLIDKTFGAPWIASHIFFKDAHIDSELWFGQFERRNGVAINRDTEIAQDGLLYDYEVVPAGLPFDFEVVMENVEPWQLGLLVLGLRPWLNGDVQIGGFRSRGLGYVRLTNASYSYHEVEAGKPESVLALLGYSEAAQNEQSFDLNDEQLKGWAEAFVNHLKEIAAQGASHA